MRIEVAGFGAWGLAVGSLFARQGATVTFLTAPHEDADRFNQTHLHPLFPQVELPPTLRARGREKRGNADYLLWAVPGKFSADWATALEHHAARPILVLSKGLAPSGFESVARWLRRTRSVPVSVLSGPNFAAEVLARLPAASVIAGDLAPFLSLISRIEGGGLRLYPSSDFTGVALGGMLKNVYAIGAGMSDGAALGENARTALLTRALAEMGRLFRSQGGQEETLLGLAGVGDLFLTASSPQSRNWQFGNALAKGINAKGAHKGVVGESEGSRTVEGLIELSNREGIDLPLAQAIHRVIHGEIDVRGAVGVLLARPPKPDERS
ncbi:NAD(P)H-dependent glycerol-3-phosphate dehydrogenase [bacterium]|nr:NAD(P)H-dependent glycerol-3-phosphate dehydrogenase [bacterium]